MASLLVVLGLGALDGAPRAGGQAVQQLSFTATQPAALVLAPGSTNAPLLGLRLAVSSASVRLESFIVRQRGSATDADVEGTGLRIWLDANANHAVDTGDTMLDAKTLLGGAARLEPARSISWTQAVQLLITIDTASTATLGATYEIAIDDRTEVVTDAAPVVVGLPIVSSVTTIATPVAPAAPTSAEATGTGLTLNALDAVISAVIPAGAGTASSIFRLEALAGGATPALPGTAVSSAYRFSIVQGGEPFEASVDVQFDLAALLGADSTTPLAGLRIVILGVDARWRVVPETLSGQIMLSAPVWRSTTLAVVSLPAGAAAVIPKAGGDLASSDGSVVVSLAAGASASDVLVSVTPGNIAPLLPTGAVLLGAPLFLHHEDAATGAMTSLTAPPVLSIPSPVSAGAIVAYGLPADGGPRNLLPTRLDADGSRLLIEVASALGPGLTVALATGSSVGMGAIDPGATGRIASGDGSVAVVAGAGAGCLSVALGPTDIDPAVSAQLPGTIVGTPIALLVRNTNDRALVLEVDLGTLPAGVDSDALVAFGVTAIGAAPRRLPLVVQSRPIDATDDTAGTVSLVRVAISGGTTVYLLSAATQTQLLEPGWNLLTARVADGAPSAFLAAAIGDRLAALSRWDAARGAYLRFDAAAPDLATLPSIDDGDALWAYVSPGEAVAWRRPSLPAAGRSLALHPGWNLVTWSGDVADAATQLRPFWSTLRTAFRWDPIAGSWAAFIVEGETVATPLLLPNDRLWLFISGDATLLWPQPGE